MILQVIRIVYFTVLHVFSLVQRIFSIYEVDAFSTSVNHILLEEYFYLKIALVGFSFREITCTIKLHVLEHESIVYTHMRR